MSFVETCSGRGWSPWRRLFIFFLHSVFKVTWKAYLKQKLFLFSIVGTVIKSAITFHLFEYQLCKIPLARCSQIWDEKEHLKNRWFLVSWAVLHRTHVESMPWLQQEIRSIVANLSRIAIQAMKANFGVAWENQVLLPQVHCTTVSLICCHVSWVGKLGLKPDFHLHKSASSTSVLSFSLTRPRFFSISFDRGRLWLFFPPLVTQSFLQRSFPSDTRVCYSSFTQQIRHHPKIRPPIVLERGMMHILHCFHMEGLCYILKLLNKTNKKRNNNH